MEAGGEGPTDWAAVLANPHVAASLVYLLVLVGVGAYKARAISDADDAAAAFHVAGRSLPWYILVGTLLATWVGNGSLFGSAGLAYRNGPAGLWPSTGSWLGIMIVHRISRRIRNLGGSTVPDILGKSAQATQPFARDLRLNSDGLLVSFSARRYSRLAADLGTVTTLIAYITIVSYQFKGGAKIISVVTNGAVPEDIATIMVASLTSECTFSSADQRVRS